VKAPTPEQVEACRRGGFMLVEGFLDADELDAIGAGVDALVPMHWDMFAANPGSPDLVVDLARRHPGLPVLLVPAHGRVLVV
jgi:hypothetical protein